MEIDLPIVINKCSHLIRLGNTCDGGYVVCMNDIKKSTKLITLGLNDEWSFEKDFHNIAKNFNEAYDHSINRKIFIFRVVKKFLKMILFRESFFTFLEYVNRIREYGKYFDSNKGKHFQKKIVKKAKFRNEIGLDEVFSSNVNHCNFLKVDIEGSEYDIISDITKNSKIITGLIIEFHNININYHKFLKSLLELNREFNLIHVHANNYAPILLNQKIPDVLELSFSKKGNHQIVCSFLKSPVEGLDYPNNPNRNEIFFKTKAIDTSRF